MPRSIERAFKRALATVLRAVAGSTPPERPLPDSISRILVVRPHNQLGDMLCATPLLRSLRHRYPDATITLITSPVNHDVMIGLKLIDEVMCFDKRQFTHGGPAGALLLVRFIRNMRGKGFDVAIVPSTVSMSFTSDLLARLSGAGLRIGPGSLDGTRNPSAFLFNLPVVLDWRQAPHRHQTLRNLDIAHDLGLKETDLAHEMTLRDEEIRDAQAWFRQQSEGRQRGIAIHPGAGKPPNRWSALGFARVAKILAQETGARIFITTGPMDSETITELQRHLEIEVAWIKDEPIRTVSARLQRMDLVISNDTGIMHVAAAVGTPVLSLFGPTDPEQWAPIGRKNCYIRGKEDRIETITVEEVLRTARQMLGRE